MSENTNVFHDDSWTTPWRSSEFPPEETALERRIRFSRKPGWDNNAWNNRIHRFFRFQATMDGAWPWGYVIYRTSYTATSDEDFTAAIEKLDRYCYSKMPLDKDREHFWCQPNIHEVVREGYRNIIVQHPSLEGASTDVIRHRHIQWVEGRGFHLYSGIPRFDYCLFLDERAVRSMLASSEPDNKSGLVGYVNLIDCDFDRNNPENDSSEHYDGSLRVWLIDLFVFALCCENLTTGEQQWGDWGMERPGRVVYTDGYASLVEEQEIFLCPSDYNLTSHSIYPQLCGGEKTPVTESQYKDQLPRIVEPIDSCLDGPFRPISLLDTSCPSAANLNDPTNSPLASQELGTFHCQTMTLTYPRRQEDQTLSQFNNCIQCRVFTISPLKITPRSTIISECFSAAVVVLAINFNIQALILCDPKGCRHPVTIVAVETLRPVTGIDSFNTVSDELLSVAETSSIASVILCNMSRNSGGELSARDCNALGGIANRGRS